MKASELRTRPAADLQQEVLSLTKAQFGLRMQVATQQMTNTSELRKVGRDIFFFKQKTAYEIVM